MAGLVPAIHVLRVVSLWMPATSAGMTAQRAVSSAEEHFLDMEGVRGSIPLPPTSHIKTLGFWLLRLAHEMPMKWHGVRCHGRMRKQTGAFSGVLECGHAHVGNQP